MYENPHNLVSEVVWLQCESKGDTYTGVFFLHFCFQNASVFQTPVQISLSRGLPNYFTPFLNPGSSWNRECDIILSFHFFGVFWLPLLNVNSSRSWTTSYILFVPPLQLPDLSLLTGTQWILGSWWTDCSLGRLMLPWAIYWRGRSKGEDCCPCTSHPGIGSLSKKSN